MPFLIWLVVATILMFAVTIVKMIKDPRAGLSVRELKRWDDEHWGLLILCAGWWFFGPLVLACWLSETLATRKLWKFIDELVHLLLERFGSDETGMISRVEITADSTGEISIMVFPVGDNTSAVDLGSILDYAHNQCPECWYRVRVSMAAAQSETLLAESQGAV